MHYLELKVPPVILVLLFAFAMFETANGVDVAKVEIPFKWVVIALLLMMGGVIGLTSVYRFIVAKTTVHPNHPDRARVLVTKGLYRYTRNPMYLALLLLLGAWAVYLSNTLNLLFLAGFVAYMNRFQIMPEERALLRLFPEEYGTYQKKTRRWM